MSGWTCPNDTPTGCKKLGLPECTPGATGCVLEKKLVKKEQSVESKENLEKPVLTEEQIRALYSRKVEF